MKGFAIEVSNASGTILGTLDLYDLEGIKIEYALSDIREPQKRKVNYTQEFTVPGTRNNNNIFMSLFDNGYSVTKFNPNIKLYAQLTNGNEIFSGSLQLTEIIENKGNYEYKIIIYDKIIDFFSELGEDEMRGTIDLSEYNHLMLSKTIEDSWSNKIYRSGVLTSASNGIGYVYPLEDRGNATFDSAKVPVFQASKMRPAIFLKTYIDKIFAKYGWKYKSEFFNSEYFKKLIIPYSSDKFVAADSNTAFGNILTVGKENAEFWANWFSSSLPNIPLSNTFNDTKYNLNQNSDWKLADMNTEVSDPGNVYNLSNDQFTVAKSGDYEISTGDSYRIQLKYSGTDISGKWYVRFAGSDNKTFFPYIETKIVNLSNNEILASGISTFDIPINYHFNSTSELNYYTPAKLTFKGKLKVGDKIAIYNRAVLTPGAQGKKPWASRRNIFWETPNRPSLQNGLINFYINKKNDKTITFTKANYTSVEVGYGDIVPINNAIPEGIKLKDFLTSLNNLFNLYWEPTENFKELRIEPYESFFAKENNTSLSPIQEWTHKVDRKEDISITPMYELTGNEYLFTYKSDDDWANSKYEIDHQGVFGEKRININTDFIVEQQTISPIFSATPLVTFEYQTPNQSAKLLIPSYTKKDEKGTKSPMNPKPRLLIWGGKIDAPAYKIAEPSGVNTYITSSEISGNGKYAYAGHLNNPIMPTEDINYGVAKEFYNEWTTVTNNNLFNKYWRNWLNAIIDIDAYMLACKVRLTALDIANFNLKNTYQVDGVFYRVNKMTYQPATEIADVELIRLFDYPAFSPAIGLFVNSGLQNLPSQTPVTPTQLTDSKLQYWNWGTEYLTYNDLVPPINYVPESNVDPRIPLQMEPMWVGNNLGTWNVAANTNIPQYTGTPWVEPSIIKPAFPATTADFIPIRSNYNPVLQGNFYKRSDLINLTGFNNSVSEQISGPVTIVGNGNKIMQGADTISVMGSYNTIAPNVVSTVVIGDGNYVTLSNATYNNGIVTKGGISQTRIDIVRGGIDEVQNPFNQLTVANILRGGIDSVKNLGSAIPGIEIVNGNINIENKLFGRTLS